MQIVSKETAEFKTEVNSKTKSVQKVDAASHVRYAILSSLMYRHICMEV